MAVQAAALKRDFPRGEARVERSKLTWVGELQPSVLSAPYTVRIDYRLGRRPRVKVIDPELEPPPERTLPHSFTEGDLCLHFADDWSEDQLITKTIVPWACEWLLHYELWLATDRWCGGGHEPRRSLTSESEGR